MAKETSRDASNSVVIAELKKQRNLKNFIYIHGIRSNLNSVECRDVFLKLCEKLNVNASVSDIKHIFEKTINGFSLELNRMELKKTIMHRIRIRTIWSNELLQLAKDESPWKISIQHELTPFYIDISKVALDLCKKNAIYSFRLGDDGFEVRRTATEPFKTVQSKKELLDYSKKLEAAAHEN